MQSSIDANCWFNVQIFIDLWIIYLKNSGYDKENYAKKTVKDIWPHILLWSHIIGIAGFYLIQWKRTFPDKNERVQVLPVEDEKQPDLSQSMPTPTIPFVSFIVPARNEELNIRRCAQSLGVDWRGRQYHNENNPSVSFARDVSSTQN